MTLQTTAREEDVVGEEHWAHQDDNVRLFMWEKHLGSPADARGRVLFVHGSSMASQPTFDLQVEGRPFSSAMNWFAVRGYDTWCVDMEGYGRSDKRRPIDAAFVHSIFNRDHPGTAEERVVEAFAKAITALDDSMPNGTYIDMCSKLPLVDPERINAPTIITRGEYDGIAGVDDLVAFFEKLPNAGKQFAFMPGISHASFQQKNYLLVYHILETFFSQPEPIYRGDDTG